MVNEAPQLRARNGIDDGVGDIAVVTGAAGGLGGAICASLGRAGMTVYATDLAFDAVAAISDHLTAEGLSVHGRTMDVTNRDSVEATITGVIEEAGRLDVVVNLAGVIRNAVLHRIDDADHELVMTTHVTGVLNTMRAAAPNMRGNQYGRFVNMSSIAVRGSVAGVSYGAAKGAIEGITRSAAMELAPYGVTANCVAPGLINAGMFTTVPADYQQASLARVPMRRAGTADEVGACVAFLAGREASYITGQTLFVCGGATLGF
jgi:3-oxoacyl-[acyl-carrier protein] reductase